MAIGRYDRAPPPPFFRQGTPALTKLIFFSALSVFLMVADTRFAVTRPVRLLVAAGLQPIERGLRWPVDALAMAHDRVGGMRAAMQAEAMARQRLLAQSLQVSQLDRLRGENTRLRALLGLRPALSVRAQAAEVLYDAPDAYSRKVVIDRGSVQGVLPGSPVVDEVGVVGQVTRVYPLGSEVTLLTDRDAAIPVLNGRTGARGAAFGTPAGGALELRFMAANADVQAGDVLTTSGVDGIYPGGIAVARVASVERRAEAGFARVVLTPLSAPDTVRHVLVLEPMALQLPPRPDAAASSTSPPASASLKSPRAGKAASAAPHASSTSTSTSTAPASQATPGSRGAQAPQAMRAAQAPQVLEAARAGPGAHAPQPTASRPGVRP